METKTNIYHLWIQYTTQNDAKYFWQFVSGFVDIWESQSGLDFSAIPLWSEIAPDSVPALAKLPDELLAAIGKFLYISKDKAQNSAEDINIKDLEDVDLLLRCLLIICRNFDNIPFIASCDYVSLSTPVAFRYIERLLNDDISKSEQEINSLTSVIASFCHFLEVLYDPYLTWRNYLSHHVADFSKLVFRPALLHVEVIPFIYDCFQIDLIKKYPSLCVELLNVLGATISGAQHNALRSVCPATVSLIIKIISTVSVDQSVRQTALDCFTCMVQVLYKSTPEQRQIELSIILDMFTDSINKTLLDIPIVSVDILVDKPAIEEKQIDSSADVDEDLENLADDSSDNVDNNTTVIEVDVDLKERKQFSLMLCSALVTIRKLLEDFESSRSVLCKLLLDIRYLHMLISLPDTVITLKLDDQSLGVECVRTLTWILAYHKTTKKHVPEDWRYNNIVSKWISLNKPSREILKEFLHMSVDGRKPVNEELKLCNPEIIIVLIKNLHVISKNDQVWIAHKISWLSTKDLRSKWLVCQNSAIMEICNILSDHGETVSEPIITLINLLDNLACTSITSQELKQIILLLRKEKTFTHRIPLLHTLCNITRKGYIVCKAFLDVQSESDGISVRNINRWNNTSYGFSFHCWIRLDRLPESHDSFGKHRQLLSLLTHSGQGLEVSIDQSGGLTINILKKSSISPAHVPSAGLDDNRWHCVSVCLAYARRALSHNQISVFIDGTQRLSTSIKFSSFDDAFALCVVGAPVGQEARLNNKKAETEKETFHGTLVKNLFNNQFLPNIVLQAPSLLSFGSIGSKSHQSNSIDPSQNSQNLVPLHGHIAHASLFNETFTQSAAKWLYETGTDCHTTLCSEETPDSQEMFNRLVFCYSALATWDGCCMNLVNSGNYTGHTSALRVNTTNVKEVINAISNVHVFFPLLEDEGVVDESEIDMDVFCSIPSQTTNESSPQLPDWEIVPSNTYAELKLDHNPVSMFLTLLKNSIIGSHLNQEELVKNEGVVTMGMLLCQCKSSLIDVNVLMATQLLIETVRDLSNPTLLHALYHNILFNFKIWSRSAFHIRIGHVQYISNLIKHERPFFRKHFGVQYFFDIIRTFYCNSDNISYDDGKTIRLALLGIIKYFISKDVNINELLCVIQFLESVKEEVLLVETLEMLMSYMELRTCKDQIFLLLHEKCIGETLYVLLLNRAFSVDFRVTLIKFLLLIVRTERVSSRNKSSMLLQDGSTSMFPGLVGYMDSKYFNLELATNMFDIMCYGETKGGYAGILALLHCLTFEGIDVKLELAKKLLTATFINLNAPFIIAKQVGWQDCIARLLIKRCISETNQLEEPVDLMTFDEESLKIEPDSGSFSHTHIPSLSEAANVIEHEIKEIAGSVSEAVADNLQYAADNLTTAVASVCSVIRQKTVDIQESLGELGHIGRVHHLASFNEMDSVEFNAETDSVTVSNRSISTSSYDEDTRNSVESSGYKTGETDESKLLCETLLPGDLDLGEKYVDKEENLSYFVANILFTILWRGVEGFSKESWKERGQVMACINLLALNNELYCSHLQLRLRLLELGVEAALIDLKDSGYNVSAKYNALYLMRLVFDLVVLDPNKDETKKCSSRLLDGVLALLDALKVFSEDDVDPIRRELARLGLGVVVACACGAIDFTGGSTSTAGGGEGSAGSSLAAPACALLHSLLRSPGGMGTTSDTEAETAYLLCSVGVAMKQAIEVGNHDQYSFLLPVMKALLEKVRGLMNVNKYLPDLPRTNVGPVFFSDFQTYIMGDQWNQFIEYKVRPLSIAYDRETNSLVGEPLNTFWAECYEACKAGANVRAREQLNSKSHFQTQVILSFKNWRSEDLQRIGATQNHIRSREAKAAVHWKAKKSFLTGPRGAWNTGSTPDRFWCLSPHENLSRMRLRLEPATRPSSFAAAARLRDNLGRGPTTKTPQPALAPPAKTTRPEDEAVLEDEFRLSLEPEIQSVESGKEKMVVSQECELITLMTKVKGRLDVTTSCLYFHDLSPVKEDEERQDFIIPLSQLREIHLRRYNLRRSALEIFLIDQTNYFLNFTTKTRNSIFTKILSLQPPNILYGSGQSPSELLRASGLTMKWVNREITNFDYLMHLNTIAGRTYNDLSQYPVYPWILADYHSERLNLDDPKSFRNLSKPIGVVNPKNEAEVKAKYENFEDPTGVISKFHYGTHYSNSAGVLHYLLRVEPFTSLHVELQSGRFDVADRQFHSIAQTWKLLMNNPNDVKELTPEFFYFPEFLKNINNLDLGILQGTNHRVGDVALPPWAENSAENFIYLHRKALESDYVSENLNHWIDLIFGYKQRGPRAVDALNVFYYCSYEGAVDLDAIADPAERAAVEGMIANFGQTPAQLIRGSPHPARLTSWKVVQRALRGEFRTLDCLQVLGQLQTTIVQVSRSDDTILWLGGPVRARGFLQGGGRWVTALTKNGILLTSPWSPNNNTGPPLEADSTTNTLKNRRQVNIVGKKGSSIESKVIAMSSDGKTLYTGGHWDCSIKVHAISSKVKLVHTVVRHFGPVTCLALDSCSERWLISGSQDTTLTVWEVGTTLHGNLPIAKHTLCGHDAPLTCVATMAELDVVVSGSLDGTVNIYSLKKGEYIQTLRPEGCLGKNICVKFVVLTYQGYVGFIVDDEIYNSIHVFTINGAWRASRNVCGKVKALNTVGDCFLIADNAGDITISTSHSLKPVYDVPLHVPIEHVLTTPNNTHILVALVDGKVAVIGLPPPKKNISSIDIV